MADDKVAPVQSVDKAPVKAKGEICWNCKSQDRKTGNRLDESGVCSVCGFNKNSEDFYNGNVEADKAAQRVEAARKALQG
jgi:hypothetical protein